MLILKEFERVGMVNDEVVSTLYTQTLYTYLDGQNIDRSRTVKCLGALLDDGLTWKKQV